MVDLDAGRPDVAVAPTPARDSARRLIALELVLFAALDLIALSAFRPIFGSWRDFGGVAFGAVVVAAVLAIVMRRWALPVRLAFVGSAVAAAVFLCYTVLVGSLAAGVVPGAATLQGLRDGIGHGWQLMLDEPLPLANKTLPLVWVTAFAWFAAHATIELAQRTRHVALPLVPPLVLYGLSLPLTSATTAPQLSIAAALTGVGLFVVLVRAAPNPRATHTRMGPGTEDLSEFHSRSVLSMRLMLGLPVVVVCVVLGPLGADFFLHRDPFDPRELRPEVVETGRVSDPLGQLKAVLALPQPRPAFEVEFGDPSDALAVQRVGMITLDHFDGVRWSTTTRYREAGPVLRSPSDAVVRDARTVRQRYTIADVDDPWLPVAGDATRIDIRGVGYDDVTGDLLATGNVKGLTYHVVSQVSTPTDADLQSAGVDQSGDAARYLELPPGLPPSISQIAGRATVGATSAADSLHRLEQYLVTNFSYDAQAPSGQSYGRLDRFLSTDRRGTAEQFATAFTVLARSLGFPTRVVVGYKVVEDQDGNTVPLRYVTSAGYHAWAEVKFAGLGWVAYDPTPKPGDTQRPPAPDASPATTIAPKPGGSQQRAPHEVGPSEGLPDQAGAHSAWLRPLVYTGAVTGSALALLSLVAGTLFGLKRLRRRRRRRAERPADRVVGAWHEVVDRLVEMRFPMTPSMTPLDIGRAIRSSYGTAAALPLAFLVPDVGRAIYAHDEPGPEMVERAWQRAVEFEQNLKSTLTRRQRWRALLSPRSLFHKP